MNTPPTPEQILQALPPQWHATASLILQASAVIIFACHFAATHGGLRGIGNVILNGKSQQ